MHVLQHAHRGDAVAVQRVPCRSQTSDKHCGCWAFATVLQYQHADRHVLDGNQCELTIRAERELVPDVINKTDELATRLHQQSQEGDACRGLGVDQLEQLRDLDYGTGADYGNTKRFGDGELEAYCVGDVDVVDQGAVA